MEDKNNVLNTSDGGHANKYIENEKKPCCNQKRGCLTGLVVFIIILIAAFFTKPSEEKMRYKSYGIAADMIEEKTVEMSESLDQDLGHFVGLAAKANMIDYTELAKKFYKVEVSDWWFGRTSYIIDYAGNKSITGIGIFGLVIPVGNIFN